MDAKEAKASNRDQPTVDYSETEPETETDGEEHDADLQSQVRRVLSSPVDRQYAPTPNIPKRIHIVGTGSIGKLVAHSLRGIPNAPPVTLIFHRYKLLEAWEQSEKVITVEDGEYTVPRGGFDVELKGDAIRQHKVPVQRGSPDVYSLADETGAQPHEVAKIMGEQQKEADEQRRKERDVAEYTPMEATAATVEVDSPQRPGKGYHAMSDEPIHNLIVTTKTIRTITALASIKHRLNRDSTICFLQNGMGVIDDVNKELFPDESTRPTYVQGIVTHGANVPPEKAEQDPFFVVHAGHGTISLGILPRKPLSRPATPTGSGTDNSGELSVKKTDDWAPSARYLLRTLTRTPVLCAVGFTPIELLQLQLEKVAMNAVINPLTCLLDNRNGNLLYNFPISRTMRLMLAEISLIIRSLPELRGLPNVPHRFSAERLEALVVGICTKTKDNVSSMLADMRAGRETEIEYMNGYIVKRGEEMGVKAVVNYAIMQTVMGKQMMVSREVKDQIPMQRVLNEDE
ncbi:putative 2-dehydropantoate 2-reductase [Fulvia fulva]|nr:putative 2-dehydropantoate 2-reductase [Fulvia fulva]